MTRSLIALAMGLLLGACASAPTTAETTAPVHPGQAEFALALAAEAPPDRDDLSVEAINRVLNSARKQPAIISAMTRPAEAKPWRDYRPIFITETRIAGGAAYWREHRALLEPVAARYGVPPEIIVAIIGVETSYGGNIGSWRVLDALVTLAFYYPPRAPYFTGELKRLLLLPPGTFPMPLAEIKGSYAGAMGLPQFMPTSYATWAVDESGDGAIDLWNSDADIFASVANYFIDHGWQPGQPIGDPAVIAADAVIPATEGFKPALSIGELAAAGIRPRGVDRDPALAATLVGFDGPAGREHWITYQNFFAITRYNRSPLYARAVTELAWAIRDRHTSDSTAEPPPAAAHGAR